MNDVSKNEKYRFGIPLCIIYAGGGNTLLYKVSNMMSTSSRTVVAGGTSMAKDALGSGYNKINSSMADAGVSNGYFKEGNNGGGNYMKDKLSGKT